jgi:hypothetical protein
MDKFTRTAEFMAYLFDREEEASKASAIVEGMLKSQSLRQTEIARGMEGKMETAYKQIQRFVLKSDPRDALQRLFQTEAEYVIGDPTEIERPQAKKTAYVGTLKDGKTLGFWMLVLATPYRGRAIPCGMVTYSSKTIADHANSRNQNHFRAFEEIKALLGEKPLVLDREFSYLELLHNLVEEKVNFVIRLRLGRNALGFFDREGDRVLLKIKPGQQVILKDVFYKGQVRVNLIGRWKKGLGSPLWIMTSLNAEDGMRIYLCRMKIEQSFRDLKSILGFDKLMNHTQEYMEKMAALMLLAFSLSLLAGEALRDFLYGEPISADEQIEDCDLIPGHSSLKKGKKWKRYSGVFVFIKQKLDLPQDQFDAIISQVLDAFADLTQHPVRTYV